ncbi:hypothetical protein SAMN05216276_107834 [Streptosporangium subroseum]|uniref:Secreted protein n=1 Tax=Streptosporangium subroseum TaxID=106412 RepID=A0A239P1M4_9ACTN|nr:hypothetical protein [Streptosporangium subroseum]SNT60623.1 hypothetical protein SAMN05216276_107834 [Streptosporangium subroseum]
MTITKRLRPLAATLVLAALFSLAAACPAQQAACAATAAGSTTVLNPPEPIEEIAPEPIEDGSYRDGSLTEAEKAEESDEVAQDDAQGC